MKNLLIFIFLIVSVLSFGQSKFSVSGGFGYRTNTSELFSLMLNYKPIKRIEFSVGPTINFFYAGQGFSASTRVYYPLNKKLFLNTELAYRHLFSKEVSLSTADHESDVGNYFVPSNDFAFIAEGVNYIIKTKDKSKEKGRINFSVCYGIPFKKYNYTFVNGIESSEVERKIEKRITEGFGFSISYCVNL